MSNISNTKLAAMTRVKSKLNKAGNVIAFVIRRSIWGRGSFGGRLLRMDEGPKLCCMGIYGRACGISVSKLRGRGYISAVDTVLPDQVEWLVNRDLGNSRVAENLTSINDNIETTDKFKEKAIKEKFARQGIKVTFKD